MSARLLILCGAVACAACAPALNWREVDGAGEQRWWFPCKPERVERSVTLSPGQAVPARLVSCEAQGASWTSLAMAFPDPAQAAAALYQARATLMMNLQAEERAAPPALSSGEPQAPVWLSGRRAGGEAVIVVARFRVQGPWLVQQVVMAPGRQDADWPRVLDRRALQTFFEGAFPQR